MPASFLRACVRENFIHETRSKKFFSFFLFSAFFSGPVFFSCSTALFMIGSFFFCVSRSLMLSFLNPHAFLLPSNRNTIFIVTLLLFTFFLRFNFSFLSFNFFQGGNLRMSHLKKARGKKIVLFEKKIFTTKRGRVEMKGGRRMGVLH